MFKKIASLIASDAAVILYGLNVLLAVAVAFGVHATATQTGAVVTIVTAVITIVTSFATRPVHIPLVTGAVATILTASAAFGLHLSAAKLATFIPALAFVLALLLHQSVTTVADARNAARKAPSRA